MSANPSSPCLKTVQSVEKAPETRGLTAEVSPTGQKPLVIGVADDFSSLMFASLGALTITVRLLNAAQAAALRAQHEGELPDGFMEVAELPKHRATLEDYARASMPVIEAYAPEPKRKAQWKAETQRGRRHGRR
jgi:hypothetical protein